MSPGAAWASTSSPPTPAKFESARGERSADSGHQLSRAALTKVVVIGPGQADSVLLLEPLAEFESSTACYVEYRLHAAEDSRDAGLLAYLARMISGGTFGPQHVAHVRALWASLKREVGGIAAPAAGPADDEALQLSWTRPHYHVSIDIYPDGEGDWFARDRDTDATASGDLDVRSEIPRDLTRHLQKLTVLSI